MANRFGEYCVVSPKFGFELFWLTVVTNKRSNSFTARQYWIGLKLNELGVSAG